MFGLICYCDSYPAIGNGHLKRAFDIIDCLMDKDSTIKIALMGKYSETAESFIKKFNKYNVEVIEPFSNNIKASISLLDTMFKPGDVDIIDVETCNYLKKTSKKLYVFNTGFNSFVPDSVDAIINYIPITKYSGNLNFKKYFGFEYSPVSIEFIPDTNSKNTIDILCIIGGSENQTGPEILSKKLDNMFENNANVTFIISPHYPQEVLIKLKKSFSRFQYLQNVKSVKHHLNKAKCVICTYGNATYESFVMHRPTFIISYLDFQYKYAEYLEKNGFAINIGYFDNMIENKLLKVKSEVELIQLIKNCSEKFKKSGIEKISEIILTDLKNV